MHLLCESERAGIYCEAAGGDNSLLTNVCKRLRNNNIYSWLLLGVRQTPEQKEYHKKKNTQKEVNF